ncbi:MAG: hypothetical protein D3924_00855 [Candidatus Electrothrix sp. AR4]|nr:hypothetical protein [Candidatus Electrothrix sp. AR4]
MSSPRTKNLEQKPKAKKWIESYPDRAVLFLQSIRTLEYGYGGENSGFIDKVPPEYRFNCRRSGGYVLLYAQNDGSVLVDLQIEEEKWADKRTLINPDDIVALTSFIQEHSVYAFDFESTNSKADFESKIKSSLNDSKESRGNRLKKANPQARKVWQKVAVYLRNPDVVAEVLIRANGFCEKCKEPAPFIRSSNNTPYLEVHHRIHLSDGGDDTVENAISLCPNCHRQEHFG